MDFEIYEMSLIVKHELKNLKLQLTNTNMREIATELRKKFGEDVMATRLIENMKKTKNKNIVISGVRSYDEVRCFLREFPEFKYISILAPAHTRFERSQNRKRSDDPKDFEGFLYREEKELSWGLAKVIVLADHFLISDDPTIEEFEDKCRVFIKNCL
ncbi:MAG: hypothetical protein KAS30_04125, partial [Candidatus Diapherotrites archaeon]|nr:hypothetical protein [Candidatus Diapherotrites archaeon]